MNKKNKCFLILGLTLLALINIFYNKNIYTIIPFVGQIVLYFLLGLNKDFFKDKIFVFVISVLLFLIINSAPKNDFVLELFFTRKFPLYFISFSIGLILSRFDFHSKLSLFVGLSPILLQSFFVMFLKFEPYIVLYFLYLIIPLFYFYFIKIFKINILIFFLIPTFLYLTFGMFIFDKPSLKILLISFSFPLIVAFEFFALSKIRINK